MGRRQTRESALQSLFQIHVGQVPVAQAIDHVLEENGEIVDREYLEKLVNGTHFHQPQIDQLIRNHAVGWELDRMPAVDLTILRMAVYELLYEPDTPVKVVINEAVELAKEYSTGDSGRFVNGILGKLVLDADRLRGSANE